MNKKSLVLMRDEENGVGQLFLDFPLLQRQLKDDILDILHKRIDMDTPEAEESNDILTFIEFKKELEGVNQILKIPFDTLIVVEMEKKGKE